MTISEIQEQLKQIELHKDDDEIAHGLEDTLYMSVIESIADGTCENPSECAKEVLKAADIEFSRWCA